jgi:Gpi18-like mannosyltransferase
MPEKHSNDCLWFTWTVEIDSSYAGQVAVLQFSHDNQEWTNLANVIVESNRTMSNNQPIDSSWAISGRNYLRVTLGNERSNVVVLGVKNNLGYGIVGCVGLFISLIVLLLYVKEKTTNLEAFTTIGKRLRVCIQGREVLLIFALALFVRILIAPWTEQRFDNYVNRLWGSLIYGYNNYPFEPNMPVGFPLILRYAFPPIWLLIVLSVFPVWLRISGYIFPVNPESLWIHGINSGNIFESYRSFVPQALPLLDFLFKLPNILADIGIGYLLYKFAKDTKYEKAVLFLWLFNPYTIHISTVWGLFDPLCTFFALGSVYLLWKNRQTLSAIFLSLGVATKMYPLFFFIPILIYVYKKQGLQKSSKYFIIFLLASLIILSSFLLFPGGLEFIYRLFLFKASPDMYGKNLIGGLTWTNVFSLFQFEVNIPIFPLIFIPIYLGFNYIFWNGKKDFESLVSCLVCVLFGVYLSYTVVNPQYVFWMLPLLLFLVINGKFSKKLYWIFSAIPLLFMYSHYNPLQFVSPVIIWKEWNYLPWSDIINQLWPIIFNVVTNNFLVGLFCILLLISLVRLKRHIECGSLGKKK